MTDVPPLSLDPWAVERIDELRAGSLDAQRAVGVPAPDAAAVARALAALANTSGGDVLLGASLSAAGAITSTGGLSDDEAATALAAGLERVDPPIGHLVRARALKLPDGRVVVVAHVRMSPSTPHLVIGEGVAPHIGHDGVRPVANRRELDDLYARGRGERERADRHVDAMIEKLTLAHYAFYNLAIVACTHDPSAEPYSGAAAGALADPSDPFVVHHGLAEIEARIGPGEIELRSPGEVGAYIRVTRSGCVATGEVQRRPYHEELDTREHLGERLTAEARTVCRLLGQAVGSVVAPHLFVEGVRGLRLVLDGPKRPTTAAAPQDTARYALTLGDPNDPDYPRRLAMEALDRLQALFPPRAE